MGGRKREIQNNQAWDNPHTATSKVENKLKTLVDKKFVHAENKPREGAKPKSSITPKICPGGTWETALSGPGRSRGI